MNDWILYDVQDKIATVTINRPEKRNAMTYQMLFDFIETMARAGADDRARVVILTGTAGAFCAGTDLSPTLRLCPAPVVVCAAAPSKSPIGGPLSPARSR